jgi:hypothetical protein
MRQIAQKLCRTPEANAANEANEANSAANAHAQRRRQIARQIAEANSEANGGGKCSCSAPEANSAANCEDMLRNAPEANAQKCDQGHAEGKCDQRRIDYGEMQGDAK